MSVLLPTRPMNAVAAAAIALLVVGAGGAVGIGTSGSSRPTHNGSSLETQTGPGQSGDNGPAGTATPGQTTTAASTTVPSQTPTSVGSVPVIGQGSPSTTVAPEAVGTTTTTVATNTTTPTLPPNSSDEPATGTYSYATQGSASAVNQTSNLPSTTTIVITKSGCGESEQWNEAKGDSITLVGCPVKDGIHVVSESSETTVDGHPFTESFICDSDSFVPLSGQPGRVWKWACHTSDGKETSDQTVVLDGPQALTVAGSAVQTEHVSIHSVLSGQITGTSDTEDWLNSIGLRIEETGNTSAGAGGFTFKSQYTIQLNSLKPS